LKKSADVVLFENLRAEMAKRHLSPEDIAHRSGLSLSSVRQITTAPPGRDSVPLEKVDRIAKALGVSAAQLLVEAEPAPRVSAIKVTAATAAVPGFLGVTSAGADAAPAVSGPATRNAIRGPQAIPRQLGQLIEEFFLLPEADRRQLLTTAAEMASKYRHQMLR
jgi:transcriptional regulator with XRE-family HTH domain